MRILIGAVKALLSALRWLLSMKSPEERQRKAKEGQFKQIIDKLTSEKAKNVDSLEALKEEIQKIEKLAMKKKLEHDEARGDVKRIVAREIERVFRDIDRLRGREEIINGNLERIAGGVSKSQEALAALNSGADEDTLDTIAVELSEILDDLVVSDKAARELERVKYRAPERAAVDVESRVEELEGAKETSSELSKETLGRLKELEE